MERSANVCSTTVNREGNNTARPRKTVKARLKNAPTCISIVVSKGSVGLRRMSDVSKPRSSIALRSSSRHMQHQTRSIKHYISGSFEGSKQKPLRQRQDCATRFTLEGTYNSHIQQCARLWMSWSSKIIAVHPDCVDDARVASSRSRVGPVLMFTVSHATF